MKKPPHLFEYLTQAEWKTCFALVFVAGTSEYGETVNLGPYHVPGKEETWESSVIAAVRWLALDHEFPFEGVVVREDDLEILARQRNPVCSGNRIYLELFALGKMPNIPLAIDTAIKTLHERTPQFNTEPLRAVLSEVEEHRRWAMATTDPKELEKTEKFMDHMLAHVGVERVKVN